ncbi:uncharacterized protein MELLADRAFT_95073 [Melampsora larici-populina 98AG31]|uniref:Uncharacterized protein n=1 Tax=Melampsora larici-populina (strain 98AG31 / pathotype 3-4-7) TaxID=747676 RepID=F4S912_MELLP|nr:uncharacterized protein MELLADRAFT_95073 [Melampsora larici-populina 98AG31]EGF98833.1 hypothetical protein MELLADRAFT_95073 [Melampsora larici-populina 98AG31]
MAERSHPPNPYFELVSTDPSNPQWKCLVCVEHMGNFGPHSKTKPHLDAVARYEAGLAGENKMISGLNEDETPAINTPTPQDNLFDKDGPQSNTSDGPPLPPPCFRTFCLAEENQPGNSDTSDMDQINLNKLLEATHAMDANEWGPNEPERDEALLEADLRNSPLQDTSGWYPFKKKEPA